MLRRGHNDHHIVLAATGVILLAIINAKAWHFIGWM
jgi:hypothetical protein